MKRLNLSLTCLLITSLFLSGCGGGVDVAVEIPPPPPTAAFDLGAKLNGHPLANVDVFPDEEQTIQLQVFDTLEVDSSGPVSWEIVAGSSAGIPTQSGGTLLFEGVAFTETLSTSGQLVLAISAAQPLAGPVPVTLYATSLDDYTQTARIDIVVTN